MIQQINSLQELKEIIFFSDNYFSPPLSERIYSLNDYSEKIFEFAINKKLTNNGDFKGFMSIYCNDTVEHKAYLTQIFSMEKGGGAKLMKNAISVAIENGMKTIELQVYKDNTRAISLYERFGFKYENQVGEYFFYKKELNFQTL